MHIEGVGDKFESWKLFLHSSSIEEFPGADLPEFDCGDESESGGLNISSTLRNCVERNTYKGRGAS